MAERVGQAADLIRLRVEQVVAAEASPQTVGAFNRHFAGRSAELRDLRHRLERNPVGAVTAVQGIAGLGKTELTLAYAHGYAGAYRGGRFRLACEGVADLREALARLADQPEFGLTLTSDERARTDHAAERVRRHLAGRGGRALLILDDVDRPELLAPAHVDAVLPDRRGLHLLATTRLDRNRLAGVDCLSLDALTTDDGVRLIEAHRPLSSDADLAGDARIVDLLGGHALACEVVAVYLGRYPDVAVPGYADAMANDLLGELDHAGEHQQVTGTMYRASLRHPEAVVTLLLQPYLSTDFDTCLARPVLLILQGAAVLAPDVVSLPWLEHLARQAMPDTFARPAAGRPDPWAQVVGELTGRRLLVPTDDGGVCRMHRILQAVVAAEAPAPLIANLQGGLRWIVSDRATRYSTGVSAEDAWEARLLGRAAEHLYPTARETFAAVLVPVAATLATIGDRPAADRLARTAERDLGAQSAAAPDDLVILRELFTAVEQLAHLARSAGDLAEATTLFARALEIAERRAAALPDDWVAQRDLAVTLNFTSDLAGDAADPDARATLCGRVLAILAPLAADRPGNVRLQRDWLAAVDRMADVADVAADADDPATAYRLRSELAASAQRLADDLPDDPRVARDWAVSLGKVGQSVLAAGNLDAARDLLWQAAVMAGRLADARPDDRGAQQAWASKLRNLGLCVQAIGDLIAASKLARDELAIVEKLARADPGDVPAQRDWADALHRVGDVCRATGDLPAARAWFEQSLAIFRRLARDRPTVFVNGRNVVRLRYVLYELSRELADPAAAEAHRAACLAALAYMRRHDVGLDAGLQAVWDGLSPP